MRRVVEVESGGLAFEANSAQRRKASGTGSWTGLSTRSARRRAKGCFCAYFPDSFETLFCQAEDEESELEEEVAWEAQAKIWLAVAFECLGCLILVGLSEQFAEMRRRQTLGVPAA